MSNRKTYLAKDVFYKSLNNSTERNLNTDHIFYLKKGLRRKIQFNIMGMQYELDTDPSE